MHYVFYHQEKPYLTLTIFNYRDTFFEVYFEHDK